MAARIPVTALVAACDDVDLIGATLDDLLGQGIRVHLLSPGSSGEALAEAGRFQSGGLLSVEHLEGDASPSRVLRRKEVLAAELEGDWFVDLASGEFPESPWPGVPFREGVEQVDRLGFDAIDFAVLDFRPVDHTPRRGDPRAALRFYEPRNGADRLEVRCWKRHPGPLDLASTRGPRASLPGRRLFPLRFLLRHYPCGGQDRSEREASEKPSATPFDAWFARLDLARGRSDVPALEQDLSRSRADLAAARGEIERLSEELRVARGELDRSREGLRARLEQERAALQAHELQLAALRHRLDSVLKSRIWRWSAPLRTLLDELARR